MKAAKKSVTKKTIAKRAAKKATKRTPAHKARKVATKKAPTKKAATKKRVTKKATKRAPAHAPRMLRSASKLTKTQYAVLQYANSNGGIAKGSCTIRPYPTRAVSGLLDAGLLLGGTIKARLSAAGKRRFQNLASNPAANVPALAEPAIPATVEG